MWGATSHAQPFQTLTAIYNLPLPETLQKKKKMPRPDWLSLTDPEILSNT